MAWETRRNGRTYYYRKRWVNGRCVSEYQGTGRLAEIGAELQAIRNARAVDWRDQAEAERAALPPDDPALADLETLLAGLTRAVLLVNGYHTHKGTWRKRRAQSENPTRAAGGA